MRIYFTYLEDKGYGFIPPPDQKKEDNGVIIFYIYCFIITLSNKNKNC